MAEFSAADLEQLSAKGISREKVESQLERFRTGFPYLTIDSPSSVGLGILPVDAEMTESCLKRWQAFLDDNGDVLKFVPASGAASRMFKALFSFVNGEDNEPKAGSPVAELVSRIGDFAFYGQLKAATERLYNATPEELAAQGRYKELVGAIILPEGLNYGALPKALLTFHRYDDGVRTALEEQLAEGAQTSGIEGRRGKTPFYRIVEPPQAIRGETCRGCSGNGKTLWRALRDKPLRAETQHRHHRCDSR